MLDILTRQFCTVNTALIYCLDMSLPAYQRIAAGFRGEEAFEAGVSEEQAMETVLPHLSRERVTELAQECLELYLWDRLGCDN